MNVIRRLCSISSSPVIYRNFSVSAVNNADYSCKLLVVGGGSAGCVMAAKFARRLKKDNVIVLEPCTNHYYQPLFTLVGAGVKRLSDTVAYSQVVLPTNATWVQDYAETIDPDCCKVTTAAGHVIHYEYLIVAVGLQMDYCKVPGLWEALEDSNSGVSTVYVPEYCEKTWRDFREFKGGEAIFTYPDTPIKCPGAPQKIAYLADSYFNQINVRSKTNITYNTFLPVIFGVKKYAAALMKVVNRKGINVNYNAVLLSVDRCKKEATFYCANDKTKVWTMQYDLLHVTPPQRTPDVLRTNTTLVDAAGYLDVNKYSLQHTKYSNIYGLGDCTNTPNSKTIAAIAKQSYVVEQNLLSTMKKGCPKVLYNGYGACPLVTSYNTCILAEFIYDGVVHETLPINQATESRIAYLMKKDLFPFIYWEIMLKGYYHGPEMIRKIINPFAK